MDSLPDAIVENILSNLSNAKDVASCNCVSKKWKDSMTNLKRLCFPRGIFKNLTNGQTPDCIVKQMVSSISRLEELVVVCRPFISLGSASWLSLVGSSLNNLEIVGGKLEDSVLTEALRATPNLTQLVLLECGSLMTIWIELLELRHCKLDFYIGDGCSLTLIAPKIEYLEVQGFTGISVPETNCLKNLCIANDEELPFMLDFGKLMALESLSCRGYEWCWDEVSNILQFASEVKHISMNVTPDPPFPEFDFVDFFKSHPKLKSFDIRGAMVAALSRNNSLKNVDLSFVIPCLEEVMITMEWPSDGEQSMRMIESFAKHGKKLKKMTIEIEPFIEPFGSGHSRIDDFLDEIRSTVDGFFKEIRKSTRRLIFYARK